MNGTARLRCSSQFSTTVEKAVENPVIHVELIVRVPNPTFRDWLGKHYAGLIGEAFDELGEARVVQFVTEVAPEPEIPSVTPDELEEATDSVPAPITGSSGLNARYTFDTF